MKKILLVSLSLLLISSCVTPFNKETESNTNNIQIIPTPIPTSTISPEVSNSLSGIWLETSNSSDGKTYQAIYAVMQILSSDLKVTLIANESNDKDALDGKVREIRFKDEIKYHIYTGRINQNNTISFSVKFFDSILKTNNFYYYDLNKKDNDTLEGIHTYWFGLDESKSNVTWKRIRSNFDLVNDFGEVIRTIK